MEFINRQEEIKYIDEAKDLSKNKLFSLSISGLRRVGKTRLVLEILKKEDLYFFVNKDKTSQSLLFEYEEILKNKRILNELESLKNWEDFFNVLFNRFKGIVVFDEFQNFRNVEPLIFGLLQKYIDLNENKKNLLLIFSGSLIGLMKKLFSDKKEPLYGRVKRKLSLRPFSFRNSLLICQELKIKDIEEAIILYALFGGFPKYYVAIEDENLRGASFETIFDKFFFVKNAVFEDEVNEILSMEFGKRSGLYYDILTAIANGCTSISQIASFLRKKETALTRQLNELFKYFELIDYEKQIIGKKKIIFIKHPLINFWFKYFYKNLSAYKRRENWLIEKIKREINNYIGKRFEIICQDFLQLETSFNFLGKQWGKIPNIPKEKNQYEIDIVALNEENKEILFCECKWKDKVNLQGIVKELIEKSKFVPWNNEERKEYFAVFAKSFKKKISSFDGKKVYCFDLKDIEKLMKK